MKPAHRIIASAWLIVATVSLLTGCGSDEAAQRRRLDDAPATRLIGVWDITLRLDRPLTLSSQGSPLPRHLAGTVSLVEDHYGRSTYPQMSSPTHNGVYDIDLGVFGVDVRQAGGFPVLAARTTRNNGSDNTTVQPDSVYLVLNPGSTRFAIILEGVFSADGIAGTWSAESFLGGGGTFMLRRHPES